VKLEAFIDHCEGRRTPQSYRAIKQVAKRLEQWLADIDPISRLNPFQVWLLEEVEAGRTYTEISEDCGVSPARLRYIEKVARDIILRPVKTA